MEADVIKAKIENAWADVSSNWKDEYAARYQAAVIKELENTLVNIRNVSMQLNDLIKATLSNLRDFND